MAKQREQQIKKVEQNGLVERELVICDNCRYQFNFLYDRKRSRRTARNADQSAVRWDLASLKNRYMDLHGCYQPCPHCGYVQEWMVRAKRWARIQDYGLIGLYGALLLSMVSLVVMLYATMSASGAPLGGTLSGFGKLYAMTVVCYLLFGTFYVPYVARFWTPNRHVDRLRYEATKVVDIDEEQRRRSLQAYRQASQLATRLGATKTVSPEPRLSVRGKALILASCALAVMAFLSPSLFPQMVVSLSEIGLMMLPFYIGVVFLLITTIGGSWRFIYKMIL